MDKFQELSPRIIRDLIKDLDLTAEQAAGIVGNLGHETGRFKFMQEIKPVVPGSKGGYGWAQWTGPRRRSFEAWAKNHYYDINSYEANYTFLVRELEGSENEALQALRKTNTVEEAAISFMDKFERPGVKHTASRIKLAQEALSLYSQMAENTSVIGTVLAGASLGTIFPQYIPHIFIGTIFAGIIAWTAVRLYKLRKRDENVTSD